MTVLEDRIEMADASAELTLDVLFECLEKMPIPEGTKVEIVGGHIFISPQRHTHFQIILDILEQLRAKYPRKRLASDVRIDFPGHLNGFASDVAAVSERSVKDEKGRWRYQDVEFVAEVPAYLIADPYQGKCHLYTQPKDGEYLTELSVIFGLDIDMTATPLDLTLKTDEFPRD